MQKTTVLAVFLAARVTGGAAEAAPVIQNVTPATLKSAIRAQKGKVVLVNFWATWCKPCVAELPALSQLQKRYGKRGLKVLLVSADSPSDKLAVSKALATRGQQKTFLIQGDMFDFFDKYDPTFKGAIALPRSYIYNRQGKHVRSVPLDHSAAEYARMIKPYL